MSCLSLSIALIAGIVSIATLPIHGATAGTVEDANEHAFIADNNAAMANMMAAMTIKPSGDVDRDFVAMMIPHHQGAIAVAQAELHYGSNQQVSRLAQEIVVEQLQEIAAMRIAVGEAVSAADGALAASRQDRAERSTPPSPTSAAAATAEAPFRHENDTAMAVMMKDMTIIPSGNIDRDFVAMMVPHHQGAIDMAQAELRYGHSTRLQRIAQEIVVDQMQEMTLMRLAVGDALPPAVAAPTSPPPTLRHQVNGDPAQAPEMPICRYR